MGLLLSLFGCGNIKESPKIELEKDSIQVSDIQELINYIKDRGYKINILKAIPTQNYASIDYQDFCVGYYASSLDYFNAVLSDIYFYENDSSEKIFKYLTSIKEIILSRDKELNSLKANPIIKELKID
jgi:hypothetical protein